MTSDKSKAIYCVGEIEAFHSLKNETKYSDYDFTYYLEKLVTIPDHDRLILFLHANIDDISFCIINDIRNIVFYHDHCIISENDAELIDQLKNRHLMKCEYSLIKQLNLICLFFDITRKSAVLSSLPIHIQMEHTTFCNARCVMCDHFIAHNRGSRHLQLSSIKAMESVLPYASLIIMHGNGEPLINPNIIGIFEIYKKYGIKTSLNTNLSYLTDDILSYLSDNCASIHVSCDGLGEKQYESIRLGLPYSNFLNNLKRLALSCGQTEKVLEVVLMRQNLTNAPAFVRFAHEYGFSKVIFNTLGCNQWIGNEKDGLSNFQSAAVYYCSLAKNEGIFLGITVVTPFEYLQDVNNGFNTDDFSSSDCFPGPDYSNYLHEKYPWYTNTIAVDDLAEDLINTQCKQYHIKGLCEYPFAKTYIDLQGNVSFCCPASRKVVDKISLQNSFEKIWNGEKYQKIREMFYSEHLPLLCKDCYFVKNRSLKYMAVIE